MRRVGGAIWGSRDENSDAKLGHKNQRQGESGLEKWDLELISR